MEDDYWYMPSEEPYVAPDISSQEAMDYYNTDWGTPSQDTSVSYDDFNSWLDSLGVSSGDVGSDVDLTSIPESSSWKDLLMEEYPRSIGREYQGLGETALLGEDFMAGQSYKLPDGRTVGMTGSGADFENPYDYIQAPNGQTLIVDKQTQQAVGYLDENLNPASFQEKSLENRARMSGESSKVSEKAKFLSNLYKNWNQQNQAKDRYSQSGVGQALSGLSMAALLAKALKGKNAGTTISSRANQGQAFAPTYQKASAPKTKYASGGVIDKGGLLHLAEQMMAQMMAQKGLLKGEGGGQDDVIDIKAAPGEYVMDAEIVSALGDGNNDEGARKLDEMRLNIRKHKRGGGLSSIPPKAKNPEQYMKKGK